MSIEENNLQEKN